MSNRFDNRIQDGLDDLISGVTGIRRSKVGKIKTAADDFRGIDPGGSFSARVYESTKEVVGRRRKTGSGEYIENMENVYKSPSINKPLQHPPTLKNEKGDYIEFPNYIHFRSLERRGGPEDEERFDIFLYVPDTLNDNLSVTYTEAELGIIDSLISNFVKTDQVQSGWGIDKAEAATLVKSMAPGGKMMQSATGRGVNPLKYQLFEGVAFRTFAYTFTLRPKNKAEAVNIQAILRAFKREALPGVAGTNSRIYTFPTEWSIQFVGPIKDWVDFPLVSVITGVNVDYAGGQPMALHADGSPSVVTLTVNFTETTQLNRQKFDDWVSNSSRDLKSVEEGTSINTTAALIAQKMKDQVLKDAAAPNEDVPVDMVTHGSIFDRPGTAENPIEMKAWDGIDRYKDGTVKRSLKDSWLNIMSKGGSN